MSSVNSKPPLPPTSPSGSTDATGSTPSGPPPGPPPGASGSSPSGNQDRFDPSKAGSQYQKSINQDILPSGSGEKSSASGKALHGHAHPTEGPSGPSGPSTTGT